MGGMEQVKTDFSLSASALLRVFAFLVK